MLQPKKLIVSDTFVAELAQIKICETSTAPRSFKGIIYIIQVKQQQSPKHSKPLLLQGEKRRLKKESINPTLENPLGLDPLMQAFSLK